MGGEMIIVHPTSLSTTLDTTAGMFFTQKLISSIQCEEITSLLTGRQIQFGQNSGFFLPFASEVEAQPRLFSGEPLHTDFAHRHIMLIEATRFLVLLGVDAPAVRHSISCADQRMAASCYSKFCSTGECKTLTIAYMRYLKLCTTPDSGTDLNRFLSRLADFRDGNGKWNGFPYYYTLLMLSEIDAPLAAQELEYAVPTCEKLLGKLRLSDPHSKRRRAILNTVLSRN
jgi:hypothetical protein